MAFDYTNSNATATRLLAKFGRSVTHTIRTAGTYDPATGLITVTETTQSATAALFDYGTKDIDGTLIVMGDKRALIAANITTMPKPDDTLTVGSVVWTIKQVNELNPAGTSVMYEAQVRK
jgi:hypothetical protein